MNLLGDLQQSLDDNISKNTDTFADDKNCEKNKIKICKHICEKKKRRCKFNAIRNSDYCVEHLAFNQQVNKILIIIYKYIFDISIF